MHVIYQIGDLVLYKNEYQDLGDVFKGQARPLIIISEPNSKDEYLAIPGSDRDSIWCEEEHILIEPDMVIDGILDKPVVFPAGRQILINSKYVHAQIGRIPVEFLETLLRRSFSMSAKAFFQGVHKPKLKSSYTTGKTSVPVSGRVYDQKEIENLIDCALDFWLTTGRFNDAFEKKFERYLGVNMFSLPTQALRQICWRFRHSLHPGLGQDALNRVMKLLPLPPDFPQP